MLSLWTRYIQISLVKRLMAAFIIGSLAGLAIWWFGSLRGVSYSQYLSGYVAPFGTVFIHMLKMVVIPIVFFSLLLGAAKLPMTRLGTVGVKLLALYLITSVVATIVGVATALIINPGTDNAIIWHNLTNTKSAAAIATQKPQAPTIMDIILDMFSNPFAALANGNFLGLIVFSILLGLALSAVREDKEQSSHIDVILSGLEGLNTALYKIVVWIMEYAPIGVVALSMVNFGVYGPAIIGPYLKVVFGIIAGIFFMIFVVYGIFIKFITGQNPIHFFKACKEPMLTAFVTRSSAAALPVSIRTAVDKLGISEEIASFSLPIGATINMDGVCVHLPMFAILSTNLFGIHLGSYEMLVLVITTVLAAIGTGGVPGGSLMLLFLILGALGLPEDSVAAVISLALGVNPILDMFETMNNVTGDLMCTYLVGKNDGCAENIKSIEITSHS